MSRPWRPLLLAAAALAAGCTPPPPAPPYSPPVVEVEGVRQVFSLPAGRDGEQRLVSALSRFVDGRMDALHVSLPPGAAMDRVSRHLVTEGVLPRKLARDPMLPPGEAVAVRYVAVVAPCPVLDITGGAFGANNTRPGFGCSTAADLAAQTADPADLLGNAASPPSDPERAVLPVARWRGFANSGDSGGSGGSSVQSTTSSVGTIGH
jgi:pilus assembly protein CpaD